MRYSLDKKTNAVLTDGNKEIINHDILDLAGPCSQCIISILKIYNSCPCRTKLSQMFPSLLNKENYYYCKFK